jgi:acyl-CoA oxidase
MAHRLHLISNHTSTNPSPASKSSETYLKDPLEFLRLDELLPAELNSRRKELRRMLDSEIAPLIPEYIERAEFPHQILPKLRPFFGLMNGGYGCRQISLLEKSINFFELSRIDGSLGTFYGVCMSLVMFTIERLGSEEQKAKYLPGLCNLDIIGCWGLTEPNFGSDASSLKTEARPVEGGFELTGEKRWIGNATMSDIMIIWARNTQTKEVEGFIVPTKSKGVKTVNIQGKLAMRIVQNGHIYMEKVFVPNNARLEKATNFSNGTNVILEHSRICIPWIATGIMAGVYEHSARYLNQRIQFDAPLAAYQLNQEKLVRILGHFQSSFLLSWRIDRMADSGKVNVAQTSLIKSWVSLIGREVTRLGREVFGGNGILIENYVMRAMADMEVVYTYEGSYDINALVTGRAITGIPAFKSSYKPKKK